MKDINYSDWAIKQHEFAEETDSIRLAKMPHWGSFLYHASIPGRDEDGNKRLVRFNIRQLFCESYCQASDLDYSVYPRAHENAAKPADLVAQKRHYTACVYDKIASYILSLQVSPLVVFEHSNYKKWMDIDGFHFDYLRQLLIENGILFIDAQSLPKYLPTINMPVVIVELISNNDRLIYNCESVLRASKGNTTITYISLLKEYDREEMAYLIDQEKSTTQPISIPEPPKPVENKIVVGEYERLLAESKLSKDNFDEFQKVLDSNGVTCLYHFTDRRNLDSIKQHGGLFSWFYCETNNIQIPFPGGDESSKSLDKSFHLEDYVRLSFCEDHPMSWRLQQQGYDLVLLKIKVDAAWIKNTLFSDINAADKNHYHGGKLEDLTKIDFSATRQHYLRKDSPLFKKHQAEVLVKTFLPLEYITNFDNPDII